MHKSEVRLGELTTLYCKAEKQSADHILLVASFPLCRLPPTKRDTRFRAALDDDTVDWL